MTSAEMLDEIEDPRFRRHCVDVVATMERLHVPGATVGVLHEGEERIAGFGVTSIDHPLAVNTDTLFQIGSITKTFVGTLVMRLVEAGTLELDAPLRRCLPDLTLADADVAERVTMRHLLTHTGGWVGDYFDDCGYGDDALAIMVRKVAEASQLTPLGAVWSYNNSGFYLAGRAIETVTGKTFESAMQELVLDPLGMKMSFFHIQDVMTRQFVVGHNVEDDRARVATPWPIGRAAHPAGGLVCTAGDLLRYARFHSGDGTTATGERLLTPKSLALMQTPQFPASGNSHIGLTWFVNTFDGVRTIGHGGATNGQMANLTIAPDQGFAVVTLTNASRGGQVCQTAVDGALKRYLGVEPPKATPIESSAADLEPYAGRYDSRLAELLLTVIEGELELHVTRKGGFPRLDTPAPPSPPPVKVALYAEDRAVVLDEPLKDNRMEFLRAPNGSIAWLRILGRIHRREP